MLTTVRIPDSFAAFTSARWPLCRLPMVGTKAIESPASFHFLTVARACSMVVATGICAELLSAKDMLASRKLP